MIQMAAQTTHQKLVNKNVRILESFMWIPQVAHGHFHVDVTAV